MAWVAGAVILLLLLAALFGRKPTDEAEDEERLTITLTMMDK